MRIVTHTDPQATLPPPKHVTLINSYTRTAMTKDELWEKVEALSALMTEAAQQRLSGEVFEAFDRARMFALAMYSVAAVPGHSVRVEQ